MNISKENQENDEENGTISHTNIARLMKADR
jgi:hypothetical protein